MTLTEFEIHAPNAEDAMATAIIAAREWMFDQDTVPEGVVLAHVATQIELTQRTPEDAWPTFYFRLVRQ
jgi:hypothetical protein